MLSTPDLNKCVVRTFIVRLIQAYVQYGTSMRAYNNEKRMLVDNNLKEK